MVTYRSALRVGVLGVSFKTADLLLREGIAKGAQSLAGERSRFFHHPTVLLSTCNRTEIYFSASDLGAAHIDLLSQLRRHIPFAFEPYLYSYFGIDCFAHLSKVTAGLDSALQFETEIQHQVKMSYARASHILPLPAELHYLFQKSLHVAKWLRNCDRKSPTPSLFGTLWRLAEKVLGDLTRRRILLIGYSEIHRGFASYLKSKGISPTFCTRSSLTLHTARVRGREELARWHEYDLVSCASASNDFLIQGSGRPGQLLFDLSVPRNIDPAVVQGGAYLYNIDQLARESESFTQDSCATLEEMLWDKVIRLAQNYFSKTEKNLSACRI